MIRGFSRRRVAALAALLVVASAPLLPTARAAERPATAVDPLLTQVLSRAGIDDEIVAIANLDSPADPAIVAELTDLGLRVHAYRHLPMAGVVGTPTELARLIDRGAARSLYWDEPQTFDLKESQEAIGASEVWDLGLHGEGVGIAILDSGVDANHPDLADHVVQNVKVLGPEYLDQPHDAFDAVYLEDQLNTDTTSGHGTHVAGDAAADGTASDGKMRGPAYGADLVGLGTGEGLSIYTALAGFDWVIDHRDDHNIRVVNNSWGAGFGLHDPEHPVVRASKSVTDAGISVVFSAGNRTFEMTVTSYSAPWNISVAAGAKAGGLAGFSSRGIQFDNMPIVETPGQADFIGLPAPIDGVGLYHPTVTGIGEDVASTRAPVTVVSALGAASGDETLEPTELPFYTHASGTSMSAPQVTGLIAIVQQAFHAADPDGGWLTPAQVKSVLAVSAAPMPGLKFFQQGYGLISAPQAVSVAQGLAGKTASEIDSELAGSLTPLKAAAVAGRGGAIVESRMWRRPTLDSVGDLATYEFEIPVPASADRFKALAVFPGSPQLNVAELDFYLYDADGAQVASAVGSDFSGGFQELDVSFEDLTFAPTPGTWRLEVTGFLTSNCFSRDDCALTTTPASTWVAAWALDSAGGGGGGPVFTPTGTTTLHLHGSGDGETPPPGLVKPGYKWNGLGPAGGSLSTAGPQGGWAGFAGYTHSHAPVVEDPAVFTSAPLADSLTAGDDLGINVWLQSEGGLVGRGSISYTVAELTPAGERTVIWSGELIAPYNSGPEPVGNHFTFELPVPYTFAAGNRLEATLQFSAAVHAALRLYYDSPSEPSNLTFVTGTLD